MPLRKVLLDRLLGVLEPQLHNEHNVELIIRESDAAIPVGENRELMRRQARGEYISFIDDDDLVPPHFVARILPRLLHPDGAGVDYIGFNLEWRLDGEFGCIEKRSLKFNHPQHGGVWNDRDGRYRDLSHVNPMRRELALRAPMAGWPGEDNRWADAIRALRVVKTEHYLDETLYYYLTRSKKPELSGSPAIAKLTITGSEPYPWTRSFMKTKLKMLMSVAGNADARYDLPAFAYKKGQIVELHSELAKSWIASGRAEAFVEEPAVESKHFSRAETSDVFKVPAKAPEPEKKTEGTAADAESGKDESKAQASAPASRNRRETASRETKGPEAKGSENE
jgi:hypothetical protein